MKSRLIGHAIDSGLIQPLPPTPTHRGNVADFDSHETQCPTLKKMLLSDKCHVLL